MIKKLVLIIYKEITKNILFLYLIFLSILHSYIFIIPIASYLMNIFRFRSSIVELITY